jgi:hypothetical protein
MRQPLIAHPCCASRAVTGVEVAIERPSPGRLKLSYWVFGETNDLRLPAPAAPLRTDDLWRTTCFEAFLASGDDAGYREFNFSPSTQWAAYDLKRYRDPDMTEARLPASPDVAVMLNGADRLLLTVDLSVPIAREPCRIGLSAVIEDRDGMSYWALAHPPGDKPDFHDRACFTFELPPAPRA